MPITSERGLKELPRLYTEISKIQTKKIEAVKKVFDNIIKQVPKRDLKFITTIRMISPLTKNEY